MKEILEKILTRFVEKQLSDMEELSANLALDASASPMSQAAIGLKNDGVIKEMHRKQFLLTFIFTLVNANAKK